MHSGGTKMYFTWNQLPNPCFYPALSHFPQDWVALRSVVAAGQREHTGGGSQMQKWWILPPVDSQPQGDSNSAAFPGEAGMCFRGWALPLPILCLRRSRTHVASRKGIFAPMGKSNSSEMHELCAGALYWRAPLVKMPGINDGNHKILPSTAKEVWLYV